MAKDLEQRGVARGKGDSFAAATGVHVDCDGINVEGWVVRFSMSVRAKFVCFVAQPKMEPPSATHGPHMEPLEPRHKTQWGAARHNATP